MASQISERDKQLLRAGGETTPGTKSYEGGIFGSVNGGGLTDFVILKIVEPSTNRLITSKRLDPLIIQNNIIVKPGIDIRDLGFASGRFNFTYEFYRQLAGSDEAVLVRTDTGRNGDIYDGPYYINNKGLYLSGGPNQPDSMELKPMRLNYEVGAISNSRTEIKIRMKNINDDVYREDFIDRLDAIKTEGNSDPNGPKIRFFNPNNPQIDLTNMVGFGAGSGPPPMVDDPASTHIVLEDEQGFRFKQRMNGGTVVIKDAYVIGEREEILITETNIINNPSGDEIIFDDALNPKKPEGVYDEELHNDAITTTGWSTGIQGYLNPGDSHYGTANIGYHAKWVAKEGRNGGACIKFVDRNAVYRNDSQWKKNSTPMPIHRPLVITRKLPAISNFGVTPGIDLFYITYFQKTSDVDKAPNIRIKYGAGFGLAESRPTTPPEGYHLPGVEINDAPPNPPEGYLAEPGEPIPNNELVDNIGEGSLSANKQWYVSSIQNGLYVWEPNYDKFNLSDGTDEGVLGIRKIGTEDLGNGNPQTDWVWRGSTWTPKIPPVIPGCTNPSALNYQSYAQEDDGTCVFQQSVLPSTGEFDIVFKCRHQENFTDTSPWNTFSGDHATFFLKYDDTLQDYHIWQSRFGGAENAVNYEFGIVSLFGQTHQKSSFTLGSSSVKVMPTSGNKVSNSPEQQTPGLMALMTRYGKIKDISEYHRYNSGYKNKRKGLIMFISFNQDYREYLEDNSAEEDQAHGVVVEMRTDGSSGPEIIGVQFYSKGPGSEEVEVGENDLGTLDELKHAVFEDSGNKNDPRFWLLGDTGTPARTRTASGARIIDPYENNDDYFETWIGTGLGSFDAIFGDDSAEKYVGISGDQVYATELDAKADYLPGFPKPISDVYAGVGEKDLYVTYGCANPFANNYGAISEGNEAGTNPVQTFRDLINNAETGDTITWPLGRVVISDVNRPPSISAGRIFPERKKASLINILNSPTYNERRKLGLPNIDGGNCDFSVSRDPLRDGTISPGGVWKWNGPDAVWEYQGESPAAITYKFIDFEPQKSFEPNDWEQVTATGEIPADMLVNESMEVLVEGHVIGGAGNSGEYSWNEDSVATQGILWVDDFDLRFQKPNDITTQNIYADFTGKIQRVEGDNIAKLDRSFQFVGSQLGALSTTANTGRSAKTVNGKAGDVTKAFNKFEIKYRVNDEQELRTYIDVRGKKYLTTNFKKIADINGLSLTYKLYEPLEAVVSKFDDVKIVKEMALPYTDSVDIIDYIPSEVNGTVLLSPKLEDDESSFRARGTTYKREADITSTNTTIKEKIIDSVLSGSSEEVELNVDYTKFSEFVNFSSAEKRVRNFKYKLELIESYTQSSASAATLTQKTFDTGKTQVKIWHDRIRDVRKSFDGFENYMYFQSSSYVSSSLGVSYDNAWPKTSGAGTLQSPYVLTHTTSSTAVSWFTEQIASGSEYDTRNGGYLVNNTPTFVKEDLGNATYLDFIKMMGHYFDKIHLFVKHMNKINDRQSSISEGLSKQLYFSVAKSLGWSLYDGKDLVDLPSFLLGQQAPSGSEAHTELEKTEQDISREIWSRIVSNMPYFLKTKGTVRGLKGLINCYGIPSSILRVREYGGPDVDSSVNFAIDRKFTKALGFRGAQKVTFNWQVASASVAGDTPGYPDTIEWRFKAPKSQDQFIWQKQDNKMGVIMKDNNSADNIGSVLFFLSGSKGNIAVSSSDIPIYDNEFYSAMVRRTTHSASIDDSVEYNLVVKKYDAGIDRFQYVSSTSMTVNGAAGAVSESYNQSWDTSGTFDIGGATTFSGPGTGSLNFNGNVVQRFSGSLMEFRILTEVLNTGSFDNHVGNPKAYDGNTISSSYENIVSRYSFDDDKNLQSDTSILDVSAKTTETQNAVANGFTGNFFSSVVDRTKTKVPNLGPSKVSSNKIRIENDNIRPEFKFISGSDGQYLELQSETRISRGGYDSAPTDSNKVGIYFSPSDAINQDIIESLANINFDNYLGDPRDRYSETYRGLDAAQDKYWQKHNAPFSFFQYLKLLKTYDQSIFPQLKKMVPARANARFGILVEPNILERAREVVGKAPSFENTYYEDRLVMTASMSSSADYKMFGQPYSPSTDTSFDEINQAIQFYTNDPSSSALVIRGESRYFEGSLTQSRKESYGHTVWETQGVKGDMYMSASVTFGDSFKDQHPIQANISSSRLNPLKGRIKLYYSSQISASMETPSSFSYEPAEVNVPADSSTAMRRLFFEGVKNTKFTTQDGLEAVEVKLTSPTRIVTKEPGDSKLDIE